MADSGIGVVFKRQIKERYRRSENRDVITKGVFQQLAGWDQVRRGEYEPRAQVWIKIMHLENVDLIRLLV